MIKNNHTSIQSEDSATTTGGSTTSTHAAIHLLGFSDTQINSGVFDSKGRVILTQVSLTTMGNTARQARKGKERVVYDQFGRESSRATIQQKQANTEKAPQLRLGNVLGLSYMPKPGGPRPR